MKCLKKNLLNSIINIFLQFKSKDKIRMKINFILMLGIKKKIKKRKKYFYMKKFDKK